MRQNPSSAPLSAICMASNSNLILDEDQQLSTELDMARINLAPVENSSQSSEYSLRNEKDCDNEDCQASERLADCLPIALLLPPEILSEIFLSVIEPNSADKHAYRVSPFLFGKICSRWREIAWSDPLLWSSIRLYLDLAKHTPTISELLDEWLRRTGRCPLTIWLGFDDRESKFWMSNPPSDIMNQLVEHCERWENIEFFLPNAHCHEYFHAIAKVENRLPLLTSLSLRPINYDNWTQRFRLDWFGETPKLHQLSVFNYYIADMSIAWSQLTHFNGTTLTMDECLEVLARTSNLVHCFFRQVYEEQDEYTLPESPIFLPYLHTLHVVDASVSWSIPLLLKLITSPALRVLKLNPSEAASGYKMVEEIESLIERSSCSLEEFEISTEDSPSSQYTTYAEYELVRLLRLMPALEKLFVNAGDMGWNTCLTHSILDYMIRPHSESTESYTQTEILLPNLRHFSYKGLVSFTPSYLMEMLQYRASLTYVDYRIEKQIVQLRSVKIEPIGDTADSQSVSFESVGATARKFVDFDIIL
ncbi:hypothetical protein BDQ12DRAFT_732921 [Crucibulum laeve]|uniref:Uncharacterized protein n=1 Tax=Crucibulum laeve TaxID=68775 RepID=A0A5C3MM45_9AGAR|nr:hypothetical protein BDQ12DRAFT_732921 [Crucibulum laeve]